MLCVFVVNMCISMVYRLCIVCVYYVYGVYGCVWYLSHVMMAMYICSMNGVYMHWVIYMADVCDLKCVCLLCGVYMMCSVRVCEFSLCGCMHLLEFIDATVQPVPSATEE